MRRKNKSEIKKYFNHSLDKNGKYEILSKKTGKPKLIKHYIDNILHGKYIFYWDNGKIMFKGNFKENKRVGLWVNYDINGDLIFKESY